MIFAIYNLLLLILSPAILVFLLYRILISKKSSEAWSEQLGIVRIPKEISSKKPVWIHAVSVGESVASAAVVSELKACEPDRPVIVTTTTQTGMAQAKKCIKHADAFFYYPFDLLSCVYASIISANPRVFASTDTEIWPNFRQILRTRGVKSALINGTISDHTMHGASRLPWLYKWTLGNMDLFCMQSKGDAERVISIGADPDRVFVTGNVKWDQALNDLAELDTKILRKTYKIAKDIPVVVAGSTNPGEDEPVLDAFLNVRFQHPSAKLIIAPRQIERREEIVSLAVARGLTCAWRSETETITGKEDVIILDTFGELAKVYALAWVSFVGGSLIPKGCHSILQPIALGKPVFFGPYTFKARDVTSQAENAGVGFRISSAMELGKGWNSMISDQALLQEIEGRCRELVAANHGAAAKTAQMLVNL